MGLWLRASCWLSRLQLFYLNDHKILVLKTELAVGESLQALKNCPELVLSLLSCSELGHLAKFQPLVLA